MTPIEKAKELVNTEKPTQIANDTGISRQTIYNLKNGTSSYEKAAYHVIESLAWYYDYLHRTEQISAFSRKTLHNPKKDGDIAYANRAAEDAWNQDHALEVKGHVTHGVIDGQGNESFWSILSTKSQRHY
ncbi:hypothetical protein ACO2FQ_13480 [Lacticaseibacillus paracasei]|uniref:hypothetical protein n=1 Tax=Lacticaseibacillus paracasei TaxID=1597 RepID=UPI0007BF112E|nr:hypothetical protein [Lacticaseibacillus paracasei]